MPITLETAKQLAITTAEQTKREIRLVRDDSELTEEGGELNGETLDSIANLAVNGYDVIEGYTEQEALEAVKKELYDRYPDFVPG